jgi:predicted transcriptional regulator
MNNLSSSVNNKNDNSSSLEWRRNKVQELASQGYNQSEISRILQISQPTINRDIIYLRQQAKHNIKRYIDERLPEEYEKCMVGLTAIIKEAWSTAANTEDKREKIQALSLAKECYSMKLDLLTNATVVDDAIRFVAGKSKDKDTIKSACGKGDEEESNEPDYDEDKDQLEEEQEEKTGEITTSRNQVF